MPSPPLRSNFTNATTPTASELSATEYNLNAQRTDIAYDNAVLLGYINVKNPTYGAVGNGSANDGPAIQAAINALPADSGILYIPPGKYMCNTVTAGVILKILNKSNLTVIAHGATISTQVSATELLRIDGCGHFKLHGLTLWVEGGAVVDKALHYTCGSPGSVHSSAFHDMYITNPTQNPRRAFDLMTVSGSNVVYSAAAAFNAGDVGDPILINYRNAASAIYNSTVSSVQTLSTTLSAGINATTNTMTVNTALSTMPASGWTIQVGSERMYVTAGGNTTTLTVTRARGNDWIATSHNAGDAAIVYKATLAANVPFTTLEPAAMMRIENGTSRFNYGFAIGMDHPGATDMDIANTYLENTWVGGCHIAAVSVGNGVYGNIIDQYGKGVVCATSGYGVLLNGGGMSFQQSEFGLNLVDVKRGQLVTQGVVFEDIRTENPGVLYEYLDNVTYGPTTALINWDVQQIYAEDFVYLRHWSSAAIHMSNFCIITSYRTDLPPGVCRLNIAAPSSANPGMLFATNIYHNTGNSDPFVTSNVQRNILGVQTGLPVVNVTSNQVQNITFVPGQIATWVTVPATATSQGYQGQMAADASFLYICYGTNLWRRVAVASW